MARLLSQLRADVQTQIGRKDTALVDDVDRAVNDAVKEVVYKLLPDEARATAEFTTSTSTSSYAIATAVATDVYAIEYVRNQTDKQLLEQSTLDEFYQVDETNIGEPRKWVVRGTSLLLWDDIPDTTARTMLVQYVKNIADMDSDGSTFPLADEWDEPVVVLASKKMLLKLNDAESAAAKQQEFDFLAGIRVTSKSVQNQNRRQSGMKFHVPKR